MDWRIRDFLFLPKIIAVGHVKCTGKNFPVKFPSPIFHQVCFSLLAGLLQVTLFLKVISKNSNF